MVHLIAAEKALISAVIMPATRHCSIVPIIREQKSGTKPLLAVVTKRQLFNGPTN
jgi:hypothetical protein